MEESNPKNIFPNVIIDGKEITLHFIHKDEDINIPKNIKRILLDIGEPASTEPSINLE